MLFAVPALLLLPPQSPDTGAAALRHADGRVPPTMTAVRVSRPPTLDGRLDDPAWAGAVPIRGFTETDPDEGEAASESTTVMLVYDADAIYVGARLYDDAPAKISSRLGRRDDNTQSDVFYVDFDSYHDHRTAYDYVVNPAGVKLDDLCSNDFFIGDRSWDPVWEVATAIDSLGWVVEMRIPFSQLRFPQVREQAWGVNFFRWVFRKNELSQWVFKKKTETGYASRRPSLATVAAPPWTRSEAVRTSRPRTSTTAGTTTRTRSSARSARLTSRGTRSRCASPNSSRPVTISDPTRRTCTMTRFGPRSPAPARTSRSTRKGGTPTGRSRSAPARPGSR